MGGSVTIPREEYTQLKLDQNLLYALQAAGVDNWEGYEDAVCTMDNSSELDDELFVEQAFDDDDNDYENDNNNY